MCSRRLSFHTANQLSSIPACRDKIYINQLKLQTITGPDLWNKLNTQKCHVSLRIGTDFSKSSTTDDLKHSLNYAVISRDVTNLVKGRKNWLQLSNLTKSIYDFASSKDRYRGVNELEVCVKNLDYHLRTPHISCIMREPTEEFYEINNLELFTVIGVFTFERLQKQKVSLDIIIKSPTGLDKTSSLKLIIDNIVEYVENSNFKTVEALVESVGKVVSQSISSPDRDKIDIVVKITKLSAITDTAGVGVSTTKNVKQLDLLKTIKLKNNSMNKSTKFDLPVEQNFKQMNTTSNKWNTAYLAFGSNIGNRVEYIISAIQLLDENPKIKVMNTSSLFESEPMYFKDQSPFINGCLQIETQLNPEELLTVCKQIEYKELQRVKHFDNGPRCIDLDIILYLNSEGDHVLVNTENLIVPHPRMLERTFVLEPLSELIPPSMLHPITSEPIIQHLDQIYARLIDEDYLTKLIPLPSINDTYRFLRFSTTYESNPISSQVIRKTSSPTYIMGVINNTPDSFSDGGQNFNDIDKKLDDIIRMCTEAFKLQDNIIIDIGGCSTRPNSKQATVEEELSRTIELIKAIRQCSQLPQENIILSIDTYRSEVANQAVLAGVDIINDISGGTFDPKIFDVVAKYPYVAYVLSHIRGNMSTMTKLNQYEETENLNGTEFLYNQIEKNNTQTKFIRSIGFEMSQTYKKAIQCGVKRWQIIMDPGLGFAKNGHQNIQLMKDIPLLKNYSILNEDTMEFTNFKNIPILVGPSRKKFIGAITKEEDASKRDFATGSVITSCIGLGCDIVRVHNVADCSKAVKIADSIYKSL